MSIDIWWYESRGQWCADVPTDDGRKRLYLGDEEQKAQAELHRYMAQYYDGLDPDQEQPEGLEHSSGDGIPLLTLAVRFLKWNKTNRAKATWRSYRDGLKYVTRAYKDRLAMEMTPSDIEKVKREMVDDGYAARTINIMVGAVKRLYNWGMKQKLIDSNPLSGVERVSKQVNAPDRPKPKHLPLDKAMEYIELCRESPPMGDMCHFIVITGMRVGEVVRITWADIDFDERMLRLERHKTSGHTNRPRTIPLSSDAIEILRRQAEGNIEPFQPVFRGAKDQQLTVDALHCRLRRLRNRYDELWDFSFHKLRHTSATYMSRQKTPERVAQAILGHSSKLMTRYYTATDKDEMLEAAENLSRAASEAKQLSTESSE